jgi:hypothetical protein
MMKLLLPVVHVKLENTWMELVLSIVWIAIQERMKTLLDPQNAKLAMKANIKFCLAIHPVSIVV